MCTKGGAVCVCVCVCVLNVPSCSVLPPFFHPSISPFFSLPFSPSFLVPPRLTFSHFLSSSPSCLLSLHVRDSRGRYDGGSTAHGTVERSTPLSSDREPCSEGGRCGWERRGADAANEGDAGASRRADERTGSAPPSCRKAMAEGGARAQQETVGPVSGDGSGAVRVPFECGGGG